MDKINFVNDKTPLNDTNLNQMQTNVENAINSLKKYTIFEGYLKGGESTTLSNVKRFIDVYFNINIGSVGFGCNKYTIDTNLGTVVYSGTIIPAFDESSGLDYYISESSFDKSTNTFTHTRTGYFRLSNQSYTDKNNSSIYIVHKIETYD